VTDTGDEAKMGYEDDIDRLTLGSGLSHTIQHRVYYESNGKDCFPDGTYSEAHQIEVYETESTITYTVQLIFSEGRISALKSLS
jgi:hypothetical protein